MKPPPLASTRLWLVLGLLLTGAGCRALSVLERSLTPAELASLEALAGCPVTESRLWRAETARIGDNDCVSDDATLPTNEYNALDDFGPIPPLPERRSVDFYGFRVRRDFERIRVTMHSEEFDTYLILFDKNGRRVGTSDDDGGGTDASIVATLNNEVYLVAAMPARGQLTGSYRLELERLGSGDVREPWMRGR